MTIGSAYLQKIVQLKDKQKEFKFHLWDTGGSEKFRALQPRYYRDADAAIIAYSITDEKSFDSLKYWHSELEKHGEKSDVVVCFVGNKNDDERGRVVTFDQGKEYGIQKSIYQVECSAKSGNHVSDIFKHIAHEICL